MHRSLILIILDAKTQTVVQTSLGMYVQTCKRICKQKEVIIFKKCRLGTCVVGGSEENAVGGVWGLGEWKESVGVEGAEVTRTVAIGDLSVARSKYKPGRSGASRDKTHIHTHEHEHGHGHTHCGSGFTFRKAV